MKEVRDRELRALDKERGELWRQLHEAPWRELKVPFQRGWERRFVLRDDARRRADGEQMAEALKFVEAYQHCRVFPFRRYNWKRRRMEEWPHRLIGLSVWELIRAKVPEELLKFFQSSRQRVVTRERVRELMRAGWMGEFWFRDPEYAVSVTRPFMVTHERVALPEVESRLAEIEAVLSQPQNRGRLANQTGCPIRRWQRFDEAMQDRQRERLEMREAEEAVRDFEQGVDRERGFQRGRHAMAVRLEVFLLILRPLVR